MRDWRGNNSDIDGKMILEIPVQKKKVPKKILDYAKTRNIEIRDENGRKLN